MIGEVGRQGALSESCKQKEEGKSDGKDKGNLGWGGKKERWHVCFCILFTYQHNHKSAISSLASL